MNYAALYLTLVLSLTLAGCTVKETVGPGTGAPLLSRSALVFTAGGSIRSDAQTVRVTNTGAGGLEVTPSITGADAAQFALQERAPFSLSAGQTYDLTVTFTPVSGDFGPQHAALTFAGSAAQVALGGLSVRDQNGTAEPSLQWIFDTYGFPLQTGDRDPATSPLVDKPADYPLGDEVTAQTFIRADPAKPVTAQVLAAFAVPDVEPVFEFGTYAAGAAEPTLQKLLSLPTSPTLNGQRLEPAITPVAARTSGGVSFSPTAEPFGFYSFWPTTRFFKARTVYTEDARNTFDTTSHHVRAYPLALDGETAYILATDESNRLNDFNDAVLLVRNVRPATP